MALQWLAEQMHQRDLAVSLEIKSDFPPLPEELALLLFQSIRELLIPLSAVAVNCLLHLSMGARREQGSDRIVMIARSHQLY